MLVPSEVIDAARDLHPSFHAQRHPPKVLARSLSAWQRTVLAQIQRAHSPEVRLTEVISLPLTDFGAGHDMPANTGVYPGAVYWNETDWPRSEFSLEAEAHLTDPQAWPSGFMRGDTLHLHAREEDWTRFDRIEVPYAPAPADIDLGTDTSSLPDEAAEAARYHLAEFMSGRHPDGEKPVPNLDYFMAKATDAQDELVRTVQLAATAYTGKVRDVTRRRR